MKELIFLTESSIFGTYFTYPGSISIAGRRISYLRYADHTTFLASDEEEMAELLNRVKMASEKLWLRINASKTKIMVVDRYDSEDYEKVNTFVYLGSIIEAYGRLVGQNMAPNRSEGISFDQTT